MNITRGDACSGARFSECDTYRYALWRALPMGTLLNPAGRGRCMFIMLNPSTADEAKPDNTVTRCINFATAWGFDFLDVGNLFAIRSTDPGELYRHPAPIGPDNDVTLLHNARAAQLVVCAWGGTHGNHLARAQQVATLLRSAGVRLHALRLCADGTPGHPLYLPKTLEPKPWT
jgi:hypothetical protein